ncbi:unnamed protein product [Prorocentrum cordatum]|uniref:Uncharacterized protein n=1 Tax=Prorocentrum cordatum TaxID=2364126 RepID=A0ABN9WQH4_9DINO|nr:unnamed protein product [Polarella glacialis]
MFKIPSGLLHPGGKPARAGKPDTSSTTGGVLYRAASSPATAPAPPPARKFHPPMTSAGIYVQCRASRCPMRPRPSQDGGGGAAGGGEEEDGEEEEEASPSQGAAQRG